MLIRLQKFLADAGVASRRRAEEFILQGRVKVNGETVREMGVKINPGKDQIYYRGKEVKLNPEKIYIILNKPAGYLSGCRRFKEKTILDLVDLKQRLYPIGRLDKNTTGLLLLTNDGDLAEKLTHPRYEQEKEYEAEVDKKIEDKDLGKLVKGVDLADGKTLPAKTKRLGDKKFSIILREGRKRQIRRMADVLGYKITNLKRIRVKDLTLGNLKTGEWRYLSEVEIKKLKNN